MPLRAFFFSQHAKSYGKLERDIEVMGRNAPSGISLFSTLKSAKSFPAYIETVAMPLRAFFFSQLSVLGAGPHILPA